MKRILFLSLMVLGAVQAQASNQFPKNFPKACPSWGCSPEPLRPIQIPSDVPSNISRGPLLNQCFKTANGSIVCEG